MRYPLADLVAASGLTEHGLAKRVGLKGSSLKRAREMGLTVDAAERYAVRAGLHPFEVWPGMVDDQIAAVSVLCPECGEAFVPGPLQRRCSQACRNRASSREWKRRNAAVNREQRRRYYLEHGDYERARQRRYEAALRQEAS